MHLPGTVCTRRSVTVGNGGATGHLRPPIAEKIRTVAIDATYPKEDRGHRTATGSGVERGRGRPTRSSPPLRSAIALEHGH